MKTNRLKKASLSLLGLFMAGSAFSQFVTYTFTSAGATGRFGPTQAQVNAAYAATNLNGSVTVIGQGVQQFTVPTSGLYRIEAYGAQGGPINSYVGGLGAEVKGDVNLTAGQVLSIYVGQMGTTSQNAGGGGGASGVADGNTPLMIAGGGGGASDAGQENGKPGLIVTSGGASSGAGGVNGNGGEKGYMSGDCGWAGGGGGFLTDGRGGDGSWDGGSLPGTTGGPAAGRSALNGGAGATWGSGSSCNFSSQGEGGFGCGGGGRGEYGGGGGGGYSGGGGGQYTAGGGSRSGGGGGSFNSGTNQSNASGVVAGNGRVIITRLCNISLNSSANPICEGGSVTLSTDAVSNISWSTGGTNSSINVSPSVTTTYSVTGTSTANCVTSSFITVTVNPLPVLTTATSPSVVCVGGTAIVYANGAQSYTWSSGDNGATATVTPAASGVYTVTGTSGAGCNNSATLAVTVNSNSLTVTPASTVCLGNSITLNASGASSYTWSNGALFPSTPVSPATSTVYGVSGIDVHNCVLSGSVNIAVSPKPNVTASSNKQVICKGESVTLTGGGASTYTWNNGDTGASVTYTLPIDLPYSYTVTGADANGCSNTATVTVTVSKCTGVEDQTGISGISLFPNPNTGLFSVKAGKISDDATIRIYNALGSLVRIQALHTGDNVVDLRSESSGIYFVYLSDSSKQVQAIKVIKQ